MSCPKGHKTGRTGDGRCKGCRAEDTKKRWEKSARWIEAYKLERGCERCGFKESPVALSFHHVDPTTKKFTIGAGHSYSKQKILEEIEKCIVLCMNCHTIIHHHGDRE